MSALAAMSPPCSFEQQGKMEASKAVSRRPRFVIKPNIRPGKAASPATKPKPTQNVAPAELQSSGAPVKDDSTQISLDASTDEHDSAKEALKNKEHSSDIVTSGIDTGQELKMSSSITDEVNSSKIILTDDSLQKKDGIPEVPERSHKICPVDNDDGAHSVDDHNVDSSKITASSLKTKVQQLKREKVPGTSSGIDFKVPTEEVGSKSSVPDFNDAITETDTSCVSEAMSLEPEDERTADVDIDLKKAKRRRIKKTRAEPLPSREKSPDRQKMKMSDLLSWNPHQNFLPKKIKKRSSIAEEGQTAATTPKNDEDKESSNQSASLPAPQIMIGPDGNVVLNTESLLIDTAQENCKLKEVIEEDDDDRYLNTNSYRKHKKTKFWTEDETERFYLGLSMCGTDFSLLTNLMKGRSRRELKNKFQREEKRNRRLVDKALANRQPYDPEPIEKMAAEEEEKTQKQAKKKIKNSNPVDKEKKAHKKRPVKKRKKEESEDEEDDWGPDFDEEKGDNMEENDEAAHIPIIKRKKNKMEVVAEDQQDKVIQPEPRALLPHHVQVGSERETPMTRERPEKVIMQSVEQIVNSQPAAPHSNILEGPGFHTNTLNAIPGSSRVQIEMEGVQSPVQGIIIPSSMVPQIAPQLGIQGNPVGIQILLVQEESASGNLVHVYVIPEADKNNGPGSSAPGGLPALSSPIPSPHPTTPLQSPLPSAQFPPYSSRHPAPVCSPRPNNPIQSPPLSRGRHSSGYLSNFISPRFKQPQNLTSQHSTTPHIISSSLRHGLIPASIPQDHVSLSGNDQCSSHPRVAQNKNTPHLSGLSPSHSHLNPTTSQAPPKQHANLSTSDRTFLPEPVVNKNTIRTLSPIGKSLPYSLPPAGENHADYSTSVLKPVIEPKLRDSDDMMGSAEKCVTSNDQSVLTQL